MNTMDEINNAMPLLSSATKQRSYMPYEGGQMEAVIISMDDKDSHRPKNERNTTKIWKSIVASAQRQGVGIISYLVTPTKPSTLEGREEVMDNIIEELNDLDDEHEIDPSKILFLLDEPIDTVWVRDYSPIFYYDEQGGKLTPSTLHVSYYSDRPNDKEMGSRFADRFNLPLKFRDLLFEGGNLISNGAGICIMSDRVLYVSYRGSDLTLAERKTALHLELYPFGCQTLIVVESLTYDITGHVDMWMAFANKTTLLVGHYTKAQSPLDHVIMRSNYQLLEKHAKGAFILEQADMPTNCPLTHNKQIAPESCPDVEETPEEVVTRTYLNALQLNDEVLVPFYDQVNDTVQQAIAQWEKAAGGRYKGKVFPVGPADRIIHFKGVVHCMTRAVPKGFLPQGWMEAQLEGQRRRFAARSEFKKAKAEIKRARVAPQ